MTFDALAPGYDADFTHRPVARWLRARVHSRLDVRFRGGQHLLELGCGTGEDAAYLAARGLHITATDASPAMLEAAQAKLAQHHRERGARVRFYALDLNALPADGFDGPYDGVYANFGVLNCVQDLPALAAWLLPRVAVGGVLGFAVMSPSCLWEIGWHAAHLDFRQAARRRRPAHFQTPTGTLTVWYPAPAALAQAFAPGFRAIHQQPLGLFLPPSALFDVVERRPRLLRRLNAWETRWSSVPRLARLADHYWIEFTRI